MTSDRAPGRLDVSDLRGGDIRTVIIAGVDLYGRLFGKRIPARRWDQITDEGLHVCTCVYAWDFTQNMDVLHIDYAGDHTGWHDFRLVPDLSTLRRAAWLADTAIVLADSVEEGSDELVPVAPRSILRSSIERSIEAGRHAFVATELEFHLYQGTPAQLRANGHRLSPTTDVHSDYNITEGDLYDQFFSKVVAALEDSGVPVEVAQVEYGAGQWEINLEYARPLEMADRHALFKHIVRYVAAANGLTATFMPRPLTGGMGSSCHVHVSLQDGDETPMFYDRDGDRGASSTMLNAVGGILEMIPDLMLWYAPTVNAMRRLVTQDFAGNGLTWGFDNRTTTCRVITGAPTANRVEMRLPGADANPYLAISAVLASVNLGIDRTLDPGAPLRGDGYATSSASAIPRTLADAAAALRNSATARKQFGDGVVEHYAALAEHEWSTFLAAVSDWDRDRYLDSI